MVGSDVADITRLLSSNIGSLYPGGESWLRQRLRDVGEGRALCKVVRMNDEIAGVAILTPKSSSIFKLSTFFVAEEFRGLGLGSALMDIVISDLDQTEAREVYVTVAHHLSKPLSRVLLPRGFTRIATERNRYGLGRHEVVFTRISA